MNYSGNEKEILETFEKYINEVTPILNFFQLENIQSIINQKPNLIKHHLKRHFIKMFDLYIASTRLVTTNDNYNLPNEAKIIIRSMFEHLINFYYIYIDTDKTEIRTQRFFDYSSDISPFGLIYDLYDRLEKKTTMSEVEEKIYELVKQENKITDYTTKRNDFKQKYKIKKRQ